MGCPVGPNTITGVLESRASFQLKTEEEVRSFGYGKGHVQGGPEGQL